MNTVAVSGTMLVSGGADRTVKVWALTERAADCVATCEGHSAHVRGLAVGDGVVVSQSSPNGGGRGEVMLWKTAEAGA